jgi:GDP-L-fucose synthase
MDKNSKILITGSLGMVGSSLVKILSKEGYTNLIFPTKKNLDLRDQKKVEEFFLKEKPEYVFHLAAVVGGIHANNNYPAKFIFDNTQMQLNVIDCSNKFGVKKLLFPGSACTYPRLATQPIAEESFLSGFLEPTNIAYAASKINGIIAAQSYHKEFGLNVVIPMPTNVYGEADHFELENSHVIPALIRRFHDAKLKKDDEVIIWGSGSVMREFIYVDDLAAALLFLMLNYSNSDIINVGTMIEISIKDLAVKIAKIIGYKGDIIFDKSKPDGMPRKCLDSSKIIKMGWKSKINLDQGLEKSYQYYLSL